MDIVLKTYGLTKKYGKQTVLDNINMTVNKGDIYGFVGKNGAGKSTLLRVLLKSTKATSGTFQIFDGLPEKLARKRIGVMLNPPALFKNCTAYENLKRYAILYGGTDRDIISILNTVGLIDAKIKPVMAFSDAMKIKLGIAIALLSNPEFIILDDPTSNLDYESEQEICNIILKIHKERRATFLITSNKLNEVTKSVTKYGIIKEGKLVEEMTADALRACCKQKFIISVDKPDLAYDIISSVYPALLIEKNKERSCVIVTSEIDHTKEIRRLLNTSDVKTTDITKQRINMEQFFYERIGQ